MNVDQLMRQLARQKAELDAQREENRRLIEQRIGYARYQQQLEEKNAALTEQLEQSEQKISLLEREVDVLIRRIAELTRKLAHVQRQDQKMALEVEIDALQKRVNDLHKDTFASSSERADKDDKSKKDKKKRKNKGHGPRKQPKLPRRPEVHLLDEADQVCPCCGEPLRAWTDHFETSEQISVIKRRYEIIEHRRQKYKCSGCDHIDTALGPDKLIRGGRYSPKFAVEVAIDKYCDHLPLARQMRRIQRAGLEVTTSTLWDQLFALYVLLVPNLVALHEQALSSDLVHVDETTWPVMGPGKTKKWWVWLVRSATAAYFLIAPSRGQGAARELLQDYDGLVMADDYSVYVALEGELSAKGVKVVEVEGEFVELSTPDYRLASCWAHIRRYFHKAKKGGEVEAAKAISLIGELYGIESEAEAASSSEAELLENRRRLRESRSAEVLSRLRVWCDEQRAPVGSLLEKAVSHLLRVWPRATVFLEEPLVPLDNNPAERSLRAVVLGRKNFQGSRSERGTRVAALFYSLIASCAVIGVEPAAYLREAVRRAVGGYNTPFLPTDFKATIEH